MSGAAGVSARRVRVIGLYLVGCFLAQIWPVATLANRIEPRIFGLPFFFAWYIAGVFAVFAGLVALYLAESKKTGE